MKHKMKLKHFLSATAFAVFFILAVGSTDQEDTEKEISQAEEKEKTPPIEVSPSKLYQDYENNEVAADLKYKEKTLMLTGSVTEIKKDIMDDIVVEINAGGAYKSIDCYFGKNHTDEAAALTKGEKITIKGRCEGKVIDVSLKGCSIPSKSTN